MDEEVLIDCYISGNANYQHIHNSFASDQPIDTSYQSDHQRTKRQRLLARINSESDNSSFQDSFESTAIADENSSLVDISVAYDGIDPVDVVLNYGHESVLVHEVPICWQPGLINGDICLENVSLQNILTSSNFEVGSSSTSSIDNIPSSEHSLLENVHDIPVESINFFPVLNSVHQYIAMNCPSANLPTQSNLLECKVPCVYCGAKKFQHEPKGFCCCDGKVKLVSYDAPEQLVYLLTSNSEEASQFRTYVRSYNNLFAFTSIGVNYDKDLCTRNRGVYTFRVHGQIHHYIHQLVPLDRPPANLQLYFYETDHEVENRLAQYDRLERCNIQLVMQMLERNPYSIFFRHLSDIPNLSSQTIVINSSPEFDESVFNVPTVLQVAAIWTEIGDDVVPSNKDIIVEVSSGQKHRISYFYGCYDPLQYPLLFPFGQSGWHSAIKRVSLSSNEFGCTEQNLMHASNFHTPEALLERENHVLNHSNHESRMNVSSREYYCYKLQIRSDDKSMLLQAGRLLQQYVIDMYIKLETSRLDYLRHNQKKIRAELYSGVLDSIAQEETRGDSVGRRVILPLTFIGGPRDMKRRFSDAMALVQKLGKPDLFITITCNPSWPEIKECLGPNEEAQNRPDLLSRVFRAKIEELKDDLFRKQIFGPVAGYVYVIEFQKRGLPHAHFLIILKSPAKIISPASFDYYVSAEIHPENMPLLRAAVKKHMMHGPCGNLKPTNICMKEGQCKNHYPKDFCDKTTMGKDSFPIYRRRHNSETLQVRGSLLDNRWVIPYNPYLLAKFDCHINVEICSTIKAVKYLYKYIFKGHDKVAFRLVSQADLTNIDEIETFQSGRWVGAPEAMWRIYGFPLNDMSPNVVNLQLHLQDKHVVAFPESAYLNSIACSDFLSRTMLTQFFDLNKRIDKSSKFLYKEIPEHYVWNKMQREWTVRRKGIAVGRIVMANPNEGERYYLRLLLNHVRGPKSFDDLLIVGNIKASSYQQAALLLGLLHADNSIEACLLEASFYHMPMSLRRLFATILVYCNRVDPKALWEKFQDDLSQDFFQNNSDNSQFARKNALISMSSILQSMNRNIEEFHLTDGTISPDADEVCSQKEIDDEFHIPITTDDLNAITLLNYEQKKAYELIMSKINRKEPGAFFIDGPGGTGKTFLYRALLTTVRSSKLIGLATATSGIAASILPGGRTAHSRFKIPIDTEGQLNCTLSKQSHLASLIRQAALIVWDEASMARREAIEAFNRMLQDIMTSQMLFGGKVVVFGGDFRQVLPVLPASTKEEAIDASLVNSPLWPQMTVLTLTQNMRARFDPDFSDFLLRVGNGTEPFVENDFIQIPNNFLLPYTHNDQISLERLVNTVYPDLSSYGDSSYTVVDRAILTLKNEYVDQINSLLIANFPGVEHVYTSRDESTGSESYLLEEDFLNTLTPNGYPPHQLVLKIGCPILLLRNIEPSKGLSNGTKLICKNFDQNLIDAELHLVNIKAPESSFQEYHFYQTKLTPIPI